VRRNRVRKLCPLKGDFSSAEWMEQNTYIALTRIDTEGGVLEGPEGEEKTNKLI
jgi:hypothetical protein